MKIFNTQKKIDEALDVNGNLIVKEDINITFDCIIKGNINAYDIRADNLSVYNIDAGIIEAGNIKAEDIKAENVFANDIKAENVFANDIEAGNIKANNIKANNIKAEDIEAWDIKARDIDADNISYNAVCYTTKSLACNSIEGRRENSKHFCLDGTITIRSKRNKRIIELMNLANEGKSVGDYALANRIFNIIVVSSDLLRKVETIEIETSDPENMTASGVFYDLAVIKCEDKSLCIPIPLLGWRELGHILKKNPKVVEKKIHRREVQECLASKRNVRKKFRKLMEDEFGIEVGRI